MLRLAAALLLLAPPAFAAGAGTTAANFLKIGVGARPVAMGEAYTALADDAHAVHYNPAGLAVLERQEVTMMHNKYLEGIHEQFAAYAYPHWKYGTFAGAITMLNVTPFDAYTPLDQPDGKVSATDLAVAGAWARQLPLLEKVSVGVSGKFINSRLASYTASAGALDAGILWREAPDDGWTLGFAIRNIGSPMTFVAESFHLPLSAHAGIGYRGGVPGWDDASYTVLAEGVGRRDGDPYGAAGFEFRPVDAFSLRAGYLGRADTGLGLSGGIGFTSLEKGFVADWFPELSLDYAFVEFGRLSYTHRVSVSFRFGVPKDEKREGATRKPPKFHHLIRY